MSLPFLKKKAQNVGVIVAHRKPDEMPSEQPEEQHSEKDALRAAAQDIMRAIGDDNADHLAEAIRAAFQICESYPHEEGPHTNESEE